MPVRAEEDAVELATGTSTGLPVPIIDLDLGIPLDRHRVTVKPEWIDWNGHMNVGYYVVAFDQATDTLCQQIEKN